MDDYIIILPQSGGNSDYRYEYPLSDSKKLVWTPGWDREYDRRLRYVNITIMDGNVRCATLRCPQDIRPLRQWRDDGETWRFADTVEYEGAKLCSTIFHGDKGLETAKECGVTKFSGELDADEQRRFWMAFDASTTTGGMEHPGSDDAWTYVEKPFAVPDASLGDRHVDLPSVAQRMAERADGDYESKLEYSRGRVVGATIDGVTVELPRLIRLLGGSLDDDERAARMLRRLMLLLLLVLGATGWASVGVLVNILTGDLYKAVLAGGILFVVVSFVIVRLMELAAWRLYRSMPMLPCPCCGCTPELECYDFGCVSAATVHNGCGVIHDGGSPGKWNARCLTYARLIDAPCSSCGLKPCIDYAPDSGETRKVFCDCTESSGKGTLVEQLGQWEDNRMWVHGRLRKGEEEWAVRRRYAETLTKDRRRK